MIRRRGRRFSVVTTMAAGLLLLAACGGDNKSSGGATTATGATTAASTATTAGSGTGSSAASGSTGSAAGPVKDGGKLTVGIGSEPEQLDPDKVRAGTDLYITYNMFETLLTRDVDGKEVPGLAASYTMTPDGLSYTFQLRQGVTFQNGDPMTADDVKFSFERFVDKSLGNVFAYQLAGLDSVTVDSPSQVTVKLKAPDGAFVPSGGYAFIVPKNYITQVGNDAFAATPIGTGPWKFTSRQIKESISFTRYDGYWGSKPGYSSLDFRIIPDDNARVAALQSGQVDLISAVPPQSLSSLKGNSNLKVAESITGDNIMVLFNNVKPGVPWADQRVRQALALAIDQQTLRDKVLGGLGVGHSGVSPLNAGYKEGEQPQAPYDPAKAKQLLADAGYKDGFTLDFVAPVNGRLPNSEQVTQAVAGFWQDIGVKTNVKLIAYSQWVDQEKTGSDLNGVVFGLYGDGNTFDPQARMVGTLTCKGAYSHTCDQQLDPMIAKVQSTVDPAQRIQAYKDAFKYVNDQVYDIYLYMAKGAFAMKKSVNWQPYTGIPYTRLDNVQPA